MQIYKMHGAGNDFILFFNLKEESLNYSMLAKAWCDRHFGVGADGVIVGLPSSKADIKMRLFNADGSEAEMSGNGMRCFARLVYDQKLFKKAKFSVETLAGIIEPECLAPNGKVTSVRVNMGFPRYGDLHAKKDKPLTLQSKDIMKNLKLPEGTVEGGTVSMGNPHFVIFSDDETKWTVNQHGQALSTHFSHPHQSNVEFVQIFKKDAIQVDTWERGAGYTLACGTGACASVAAGRIMKGLAPKVSVTMEGGFLDVEWDGEGPVFLSGSAHYVFEGEVSSELLKPLTLRVI